MRLAVLSTPTARFDVTTILMLLTFEKIALPVGLFGLVVILAVLWLRKRGWPYTLAAVLFWFYMLVLIRLTLFPTPVRGTPESRQTVSHILSRINFTPFSFGSLFDLHPNVIRFELLGNILLTVPFGLGLPILVRGRTRIVPWLAATVGLFIETAQLLISLAIGGAYRAVDINDVLLNGFGGLIGYGLFKVFERLIFRRKHTPLH